MTADSINNRYPGKANILINGKEVLFISCGSILKETIIAIDILSSDCKSGLINIHSLKPLDIDSILGQICSYKFVVTVEEHSVIGGLGSAIAEIIAQSSFNVQQLMIGVPDTITTQIGKRDYLLKQHGMDASSIAKRVKSFIVN